MEILTTSLGEAALETAKTEAAESASAMVETAADAAETSKIGTTNLGKESLNVAVTVTDAPLKSVVETTNLGAEGLNTAVAVTDAPSKAVVETTNLGAEGLNTAVTVTDAPSKAVVETTNLGAEGVIPSEMQQTELINQKINILFTQDSVATVLPEAIDKETYLNEVSKELEACNPNYETGKRCWKINCQKCVPTFEMRRRGFDVTALKTYDLDPLAYEPFSVWKDPDIIKTTGNGLSEIKEKMAQWGDGARAQITLAFKDAGGIGHTFVAEQVNGETVFLDPQSHETDVSYIFEDAEPGSVEFCRIDNLSFKMKKINDFCKEVK